jgi:exopolyphosphatase/guanosine-5'-triphosphate,3'-diphosphate pyrophosphatase
MSQRFAVIDLGSNTFHLLIADCSLGKLPEVLYRERVYVKLAKGGVESIAADAFDLGIATMKRFANIMAEHHVSRYKALGTAALRHAINAGRFIEQVAQLSGLHIETIDGEEEAQLIKEGVALAIPDMSDHPTIIMDIGGGSVEYILHNLDMETWHRSFPVGVAVMRHRFQSSTLLQKAEQAKMLSFLDQELQPLSDALSLYRPRILVGASGTFEVLEQKAGTSIHPFASEIDLDMLHLLQDHILDTTNVEDLAVDWIPEERRDLIQVAFVLIQWTLRKVAPHRLWTSQFALKEGVLAGMITKQ